MTFVGHHVSSKGIWPLEDKVQAVREFPQATMQLKWCEFLGLINFYHQFLNDVEAILKPLNDLQAALVGRKKELAWTAAALKAFTQLNKPWLTPRFSHIPS